MTQAAPAYDPRYLAGILFFNDRDFFEAHEVWEDLWMNSTGPERRFVQGLIQAAVALFHFGNGNLRGAVKLYHSGRAYIEPLGSPYWGVDTARFWEEMGRCFAEVLPGPKEPDRALRPRDELIPVITLAPAPESWPDPADFADSEE